MNSILVKPRPEPAHIHTAGRSTLPACVLEIQPGFVSGARLGGAGHGLRRIVVREVEPRALEPAASRSNFVNPAELRRALGEVREILGNAPGRLGLVVPDAAVRVSTLEFETLPDNAREAEALVSWKMRENLPCAPEEARISYQAAPSLPGRVELLAVAAKNSVLREYEQILEARNGGPVLIVPATLALLPLVPQAGSHLLVHVCCGWVTTVVVEGNRARLWRNRELAGAELIQSALSEVVRVMASTDDRLKLRVEKVWLCARPSVSAELVPELARRLSRGVERLETGSAPTKDLPQSERTLFEIFGAPVAGLISNNA